MAADGRLWAQEGDSRAYVQAEGTEAEGVLHNRRGAVGRSEHKHVLSGWGQEERQLIQPAKQSKVRHGRVSQRAQDGESEPFALLARTICADNVEVVDILLISSVLNTYFCQKKDDF